MNGQEAQESEVVQEQETEVTEPVQQEVVQPVVEAQPEVVQPVVEAQPVPEPVPEPTFAERLQVAISQFSGDVSSLKAMDTGVEQANENVAAAHTALTAAQSTQTTKASERDAATGTAMESRDALVAVLRSWSP